MQWKELFSPPQRAILNRVKSVTKIVKNEKYQSFHLPIDMALRSSKIFFVCSFYRGLFQAVQQMMMLALERRAGGLPHQGLSCLLGSLDRVKREKQNKTKQRENHSSVDEQGYILLVDSQQQVARRCSGEDAKAPRVEMLICSMAASPLNLVTRRRFRGGCTETATNRSVFTLRTLVFLFFHKFDDKKQEKSNSRWNRFQCGSSGTPRHRSNTAYQTQQQHSAP